MKTSRVSRIIQILTALQSGQHYSVNDLANILGIGRRTIFRDLKDIQNAGIPCYYDKQAQGYTIDPEFFMATPGLSAKESFGLLLLVHKSGNRTFLPFQDSILQAALKIENNIPGAIKGFCHKAFKAISMSVKPPAQISSFDKTFIQLIDATLKKQVVNIRYYLPRDKRNITMNFNPYHLLYDERSWYVLGKSNFFKGVRALKLSRIEELKITDKCFVEDKEFDVAEYIGKAWAIVPEGKLYNIKLKFTPDVAHDVAKVQWHKTQSVTFEDDGSVIVEFCIDGLNEITWWILSYGDNVQILEPEKLRKRIITIAENTIRKNRFLLSTTNNI